MTGFPAAGEEFGRYRIVRQVGEGGMGVVFAAVQESLGREVALKVLRAELASQPEFVERFAREAAALARLDSPHVIHVYDHGEVDGHLYIAAQLVPDGDLGQLLSRHGPPPLPEGLDLLAQLAGGLADAHEAGLIHRDIKPANVLVRRRAGELTAYLSDFGIARAAGTDLTHTGALVGTPAYMAPELHEDGEAGIASDVYSLGCLLWAVLTGRAPYVATTEYRVISAHLHDPIPTCPNDAPLAAEINRILAMAMAKDPAHRYTSARQLRADLQHLVPRAPSTLPPPPRIPSEETRLRAAPTPAHSASPPAPSSRTHPRRRALAVSAAVLLVAGAAVAAGWTVANGGPGQREAGGTPTTSATPTRATPTPTPTAPTVTATTSDQSDSGDRGVALANLTTAFEDQGLEADKAQCAAEKWLDDVGLSRMLETGVLEDDLSVAPNPQPAPPSDVTLAGVGAVTACAVS